MKPLPVLGGLGKTFLLVQRTLDNQTTAKGVFCSFLFPAIRSSLASIGLKPRGLNRGSESEVLAGTYDPKRFTGTAFRLSYPETGSIQKARVERTYPKGEEPWLEHLTIRLSNDHIKKDAAVLFSADNKLTLAAIQKEEDIELCLRGDSLVEIILGKKWFNPALESLIGKVVARSTIEQILSEPLAA